MITEASNKIIKEVDEVKSEMERKWGVGGLEEAVADTLREKFKRQYDKLFNAIDNKNNEDIQKHGQATIKGWQFLDKEASKLVWAFKLPPNVWQIQHSSGVVMTVYNGEIEKKDKKGVVIRQSKPPTRLYAVLPAKSIQDDDLHPTTLRVLGAICIHTNKYGICWPSRITLGRHVSRTPKTISFHVTRLIKLGYIRKLKKRGYKIPGW